MNYRMHAWSSGAKLAAFVVISLAVIVVIAATIRPFRGGGQHEFRAVFASASDLQTGDQVRVAGVVSGHVTGVSLDDDTHAVVTFEVDGDLPLTVATKAQIRYLNLLGNRYLALHGSRGARLEPGSTIPIANTSPALDLDDLFAGFKPLFTALSPADANALAADIVQTLQGEGGTVTSLLRHTAQVTSNLADRDEVIGRVVDNLGEVLATVDAREQGLNTLVSQLNRYVGGLAGDREAIGESIGHIDAMAAETAGLISEARPDLKGDVTDLGRVARTLNSTENRELIDDALRTLPAKLARISRVASYGSWFNFYLCNLSVTLGDAHDELLSLLLGDVRGISIHDTSDRCRP